jgi:CheY-like chemotaxis protein
MTRRVLDVGNCALDHGCIRELIEENFDARVEQAHDADGALAALHHQTFDLVLVNRILDRDQSSGLDLIRALKVTYELQHVPVILLSNYPDAQAQAEVAGAEPGFGKCDIVSAATLEKLRKFLA